MGKRIITNKHGLPDTLVRAVSYDTHRVVGTISVTTLIDAPKIRYLKQLHDYEVDVSELLYALMGTALHNILERANMDTERERAMLLTADTLMQHAEVVKHTAPEDYVTRTKKAADYIIKMAEIIFPPQERRYLYEQTLTLKLGEDHLLSGTFDLYDKEFKMLQDYKFCSVYNWIFPEARRKWIEQLNIYAYMLKKVKGIQVDKIRVIAFFRDWSEMKLKSNKDYPARQTMEIDIPMMDEEDVHNLIMEHISRHRMADEGNPPPCNGKERWATSSEYAVMMKGRAAALKIYTSQIEAEGYIAENKHKYDGLFIQMRPGVSKRCSKYCVVRDHCDQYRQELNQKDKVNITEPTILPR